VRQTDIAAIGDFKALKQVLPVATPELGATAITKSAESRNLNWRAREMRSKCIQTRDIVLPIRAIPIAYKQAIVLRTSKEVGSGKK
jgi:hypothetical protein